MIVMDLPAATASKRDDEEHVSNVLIKEQADDATDSTTENHYHQIGALDDLKTEKKNQDGSQQDSATESHNQVDSSKETDCEERPLKRRRTTDNVTPQSRSRAVSPPWRKHGAEGPTTFLIDGKRKSARFNALPLELQHDKRSTRASATQSPSVSSKYSSIKAAQSTTQVHKHSPSKGDHVRGSSFSHAVSKQPLSKHSVPHTKAITKNELSRRQSRTHRTPSPPRSKRLSVATPKQKLLQEAKSKHQQRTNHDRQETSRRAEPNGDVEDCEEDVIETIPRTPVSDQKPRRLRLKFNMASATPKVQHPIHLPPMRMYQSFKEWFETERHDEEAPLHMTNEEIVEEAKIRSKVNAAAQPGGLLDLAEPQFAEKEGYNEPPRQYTRHDFTIAHAIRFRQLMDREQRKHVTNAKKYAYDARTKWRASQPKSEDEIRAEQDKYQEAFVMATMKQCIQDLSHKWSMFRQEIHLWRLERWKEEQDALGKENLKRVIQESEALLDSRLLDNSDDSASDEESDGDKSLDEGDVEDNMSSDDSGSEEDKSVNSDDELTAEELRRKYENAGETSRMESEDVEASCLVEDDGDDDQLMKGLDFDNEDVKAKIAQAQKDSGQAGLSEDESTDMDSESDMDSDEEDSDDDSQGSEVSEDEAVGLAALLGGSARSRQPKTETAEMKVVEESSPTIQISGNVIEEPMDIEANQVRDAAQVQTPVSNNEAPISSRKDLDHSPHDKASGLRVAITSDVDDAMDLDRPDGESRDDHHISLPATPISVDLDKKHIASQEIPHLLRANLREYQKEGFNWLADRYEHGANSILADEMGLGKTIQTITLLAHLALKHEIWGPHLIVVPTSVILNWEMEFKKFLPSFKVLSYYGSPEERKAKRKGWLDDNQWNAVITSYHLVVSDQNSFKRRGWHYLVLDEAHNIKNFRSQRWQTLLTFRSHSRLLLTGTPLQNNLEELWSLLFFLVGKDKAEDFLGRQEFALLFKKPADQILEDDQTHLDAEAREQVQKLHQILRPRLLRRLKADVEKQMPGKYEHVVYCRLSKRQRYLYDGFLSRSQTRETLARGNYLSIINCLMQLRKVCNHPDLFETRPIVTSFAMKRSVAAGFESQSLFVLQKCQPNVDAVVNLDVVDLLPGANGPVSALDTIQKARLNALFRLRELVYYQTEHGQIKDGMTLDGSSAASTLHAMNNQSKSTVLADLQYRVYLTSLRSQRRPLFSHSLAQRLTVPLKEFPVPSKPKRRNGLPNWFACHSPIFGDIVKDLEHRTESMQDYIIKFTCTTPAVVAPDLFELAFGKPTVNQLRSIKTTYTRDLFKESNIRQAIAFPDKRLLQFDCGKLQKLDSLLRTLQGGGHRALIFTQMTKVLDILEQFLNIHGHRYLRLDGSTKLENRQLLTERFNTDTSILAFILSSRSGGLGINLTGADTVIFYDLDWNPAMDKQCQDRAHRIGQTRDVHIYRFVSEHTIEANILRKSNQKRLLDDVIIQEGDFTTDYFNKPNNPRDLFDDPNLQDADAEASAAFDRVLGVGNVNDATAAKMLGQAEDREDVAAARIAAKEVENADDVDFDEKGPNSNKTTRPSSRQGLHHGSGDATGHGPDDLNPDSTTDISSQSNAWITGEIAPRTDMAIDIFKEKQAIGIDRHMVEYLEWEVKDEPFVPPEVKKKRRNDDHRVRRKR